MISDMQKRIGTLCALALALLAHAPKLFAQSGQAEFKIHNRGDLWETVKSNGTVGAPNPTSRYDFQPSMDWPGGPTTLVSKDEQRSYHAGGGMWVGGKRGGQVFFTENGPFSYVDLGTFNPITKTLNFCGSTDFDPALPEETVTASWSTTENMRVNRVTRAWSFREYRNAIFFEYTVTNGGTQQLDSVYIGFPYLLRPSYQDFVVHNGWGDDLNRADDLVGFDSTLKLLYSYDDTPNQSLPTDVGNYWAGYNEVRTTGYAGIALLYADSAADRRPQPANILWAQLLSNERYLTITNNSKENLYAILTGADRSLQAPAGLRLSPFTLISCGPYTLAPSASVRIVLMETVNGIPIDQAVNGLSAQALLPRGLDSVRASVRRARTLFANNMHPTVIPPPAPPLELFALPTSRSIYLLWPPIDSSYANPITGRHDIKGYRVYRAERSFNGPYRKLRTFDIIPDNTYDRQLYFDTDQGKWRYSDQTINIGTAYWYAVTAVDSSNRESWMTNRNEVPIRAVAQPDTAAPLDVKVFPNPFREVSGFPTAGEEKTIAWTNLPTRCTIRIFTSSGELVKTIHHDNPLAGTAVWDQLTDARQRTASGIYFWTVESDLGNDRGTLLIMK
jgi:hypothetical protein